MTRASIFTKRFVKSLVKIRLTVYNTNHFIFEEDWEKWSWIKLERHRFGRIPSSRWRLQNTIPICHSPKRAFFSQLCFLSRENLQVWHPCNRRPSKIIIGGFLVVLNCGGDSQTKGDTVRSSKCPGHKLRAEKTTKRKETIAFDENGFWTTQYRYLRECWLCV